jgi:hypothetical protein
MASSAKNNGVNVAKDHEDEIQIEPINIDAASLKRAVEEKSRVERLQSQDSVKGEERNKKTGNFKNRRQSSGNGNAPSKQYSRQSSTNDRAANGGSEHSAKDRRTSYNRSKNSKQSFDEKPGRAHNNKGRSTSTTQSQDGGGAASGDEKKRNRSSTASNGKFRNKSYSVNSTDGASFEYDDYELEEPFTDSDEETVRAPQKPLLIIPRGRIRTLSGTIPPTGFSPKFGGPTMCLSCLQFFDLPDLIDKFADHLLNEHQIVIEEVDLIVDPKRYVEHWRQRFAKQPISEIFPKVVPKEGDEL